MRGKNLAALMAVTLGQMVVGCGGTDGPSVYQPPAATTPGDPNKANTTTKKLQKPAVDIPASSLCGASVPLQGTVIISSGTSISILVTGGASDISTDPNTSTGRFCVDVPLKANQTNQLKVFAHDPDLGLSEATVVNITQSGCKDDVTNPTETVKPTNVALGVKATNSDEPDSGNVTLLTDNLTTSPVVYSGGWAWTNADIWISLKLDKLVTVDKIVVKWRDSKGGSSEQYGKRYRLLVASGTPGDPDLKNGYWTEIGTITEGDGGTDTFDLKSTKPLVQHVALWLEQDGSTSWSETFAVTEIEVWDSPKSSTSSTSTTSKTSTCSSIGSSSW